MMLETRKRSTSEITVQIRDYILSQIESLFPRHLFFSFLFFSFLFFLSDIDLLNPPQVPMKKPKKMWPSNIVTFTKLRMLMSLSTVLLGETPMSKGNNLPNSNKSLFLISKLTLELEIKSMRFLSFFDYFILFFIFIFIFYFFIFYFLFFILSQSELPCSNYP